ncbi:RNA-directed DNA polymerase, eukaryota [Tanacetum coccineum]|uniref:RNA-directed DNA polymerase, eukaryota n=1 Tax=Tanacetum coccineum TaxID=301880 RepID=A0ABQ5E7L3_9ASTR
MEERPDIIGIQETKCGMVDDTWVEDIWGDRGFGFTQLVANGNSGGIILIWDARSFTYRDGMCDERFVAVKGDWKGRGDDIYLACVYGPHVGRQKSSLWGRLIRLMKDEKGAWCIFGDLNVVRGIQERMNSQVNNKETSEFNDFINEAKLIEVPMGGGNLLELVMMLEEKDIKQVVHEAWKLEVRSSRPDCRFRDKLKNVKGALKNWSKERFGRMNEKIEIAKKEAMRWEMEAEMRPLNENERATWMEERKTWMNKENEYRSMLR